MENSSIIERAANILEVRGLTASSYITETRVCIHGALYLAAGRIQDNEDRASDWRDHPVVAIVSAAAKKELGRARRQPILHVHETYASCHNKEDCVSFLRRTASRERIKESLPSNASLFARTIARLSFKRILLVQ